MDLDNTHMFDVRDVDGKGKGLFATRLVPKGTCILSETPVITVPVSPSTNDLKTLWIDVTNLPGEQRHAFESLSNCHPYENIFTQYLSIVRTNCFSTYEDSASVCLVASRINHACDANAQHTWNDKLDKIMVHALRNIAEDEEITTNYMGREHTRQERQEQLKEIYKFECSCELCSLPPVLSEAADRKVLRARKLWANFQVEDGQTRHLSNPLQRLWRLEEIARHRAELGSCTQMHDTHVEASALALSHSDLARGKVFLERAYTSYVIEHGDDDKLTSTLRARLQDLTSSDCYGQSTRWQTGEADVPPKNSPVPFEEWLWKKEEDKPKTGLFADLWDRSTFLGIGGLPTEGLFDVEYHQDASMGQSKPKRHWCFVGEIIDKAAPGGQLQLIVKDVDNHITGVFFHDRHKGETLSDTLRINATIVVLYAQRAQSDAGAVVKVRNTSIIRDFHVPLKKLLGLSSRLLKYATPHDSLRTCHGCAREGSLSLKCGRCGLFWYCDSKCQMTGWNNRNHKTDCKILRNDDVRSLFTFRWHEFEEPVRFPLPASDERMEDLTEKASKITV
ncbi:hypothetical protein P171DRAFT_257552 [Karstenula rhodostoma CBS 690.94]|uniref:MYND-type zinc finger protein samB n=1 Tax=Karstenula rhodostoma CBS 690.94 TaxID=1392251 RepID=A0A9P4UED3_9PLEO|nr:hypothetical protein P171DRAFT_257552 [Karstenula rhodostoma CBS 690.94]